MEVEVGKVSEIRVRLTDADALEVVAEGKWKSMSLPQRGAFLAALGDVIAADYSRTNGWTLPEAAEQRIAEASQRMQNCLK